MQVLGDLIRLESETKLPLPWWHRAPLGLMHDTWVWVAVLEPAEGRGASDVIVSTLDPSLASRTIKIDTESPDRPGLLEDVYSSVAPLNIALAEASLLETGQFHTALMCQPETEEGDVERLVAEAEERFASQPELNPNIRGCQGFPAVRWQSYWKIDHGWALDPYQGESWMKHVLEHATDPESMDLSCGVITADTRLRMSRYIFPRKGARSVEVQHADKPRALQRITGNMRSVDLNALCELNRRGGAKPKHAVWVSVLEPVPESQDTRTVEDRIREAVAGLPAEYGAKARVRRAVQAEATLYPRRPDQVLARVPEYLRPEFAKAKEKLVAGKKAVFLSRRFFDDSRSKLLRKAVLAAVDILDWQLVEVPPSSEGEETPPTLEVLANLWVCDALVVLVTAGPDPDVPCFTPNLSHEVGFYQGQGKPLLFLAERGRAEDEVQAAFTNFGGGKMPRFAYDQRAFDPDDPNSIETLVRGFLGSWS